MTERYNFSFSEYPDGFFGSCQLLTFELAEWAEGEVVDIEGVGTGVITAVMTESFEFPVGDDELRDIEASSDDPVYIAATEEGMRALSEDMLSEGEFEEDGDPQALAEDAELAAVYEDMDDPYDVAELLNVPGVDDPGVGFDRLPDGWNRLTLLDAWSSLGGTFTTCRADMVGEVRSPTRFCAAMKDSVYMTEKWRNRF